MGKQHPLLSSLHKFEYVTDVQCRDINMKNQKSSKCILYLFQEMVLAVKPKGNKYTRKYLFQTPSVTLLNDFKPNAKVKFPIELQIKEERYLFDCSSSSSQYEFSTALSNLLKQIKDGAV